MRLTTVILIASLLQVSAAGFAQRLSLNASNSPLKSVLKTIRSQSGYNFVYSEKIFNSSKPVNINVKDAELSQVLSQIFRDQPLSYQIENKTIVVKLKEEPSFIENLIARFQKIDVRGKVVDSLGNGLAGATVSVKNGKGSTSTDAGGNFMLRNVDEGATLVVNYLGFITKEVAAKEYTVILLQQSESKLDEVQIQAYGVTSKRLSTGNISSIKAEDIAKQPVSNPLLALAGRVPGLIVTQNSGFSGSGVGVQIQGPNSLFNGNDPFYVIDGVPYVSQLLPNFGSILDGENISRGNQTQNGSPFSFVNPQDIESIEILKDAAATAIYGSRASSGAILITTKKGKSGKTKVNLNAQTGTGRVGKKLNLLNTQQYLEMRKEAYSNDNLDVPSTSGFSSLSDLTFWDQNKYTNWQDELIGNSAKYNDLQLNVSGGNTNTQFLVGANFHRETTVFPSQNSDKKGSVRFNINNQSDNQKFRFNLSGSYLSDINRLPNVDLTSTAMTLSPNAPDLKSPDGSINWAPFANGSSSFGFTHPLSRLESEYRSNTDNLIANTSISYELIRNLRIKTDLGYTSLFVDEIKRNPSSVYAPNFRSGIQSEAEYGSNGVKSWIAEPQLTFNTTVSKGKLDFLLGTTLQQRRSTRQQFKGTGYLNDEFMDNINSAQTITTPPSSAIQSDYKYSAIFVRIGYNWGDRYILDLSARRDGSSRFGIENQFHNFGAVGAAWIFSNEELIKKHLSLLSFGKFRFSYGTTGSDQLPDYAFLSLYLNNNPANPYSGGNGLYPYSLPNNYLQWEEVKKLNLGIDLGFLKDRLIFNLGYFRNRASDQLLAKPLAPSVGFTTIESNLPAVVQNDGFEIAVSSKNINTKNFNWTTNFNLTIPKNQLISFENLSSSVFANSLEIGKSVRLIKAYNYNGLNTSTGTYQFTDKNGSVVTNPSYDSDNDYLRFDADPDFYGGISNSFIYKGFSIDFLFQFVKKKGFQFLGTSAPGTNKNNQLEGVLDRWKNEGDNGPIQKYSTDFAYEDNFLDYARSNANWVDASFIKLRNASFSWQLPERWASATHFEKIRLFAQGQNLFTITKYKGWDPEAMVTQSLPPLRVITFGVNLTL